MRASLRDLHDVGRLLFSLKGGNLIGLFLGQGNRRGRRLEQGIARINQRLGPGEGVEAFNGLRTDGECCRRTRRTLCRGEGKARLGQEVIGLVAIAEG